MTKTGKTEKTEETEKKGRGSATRSCTGSAGSWWPYWSTRSSCSRSTFPPSMENTLLLNDYVAVNKLAYKFGDVDRGDIVVFKGWDGEDTIKRVIGVGGDTVKCCDTKRRITVNGTPLEEEGAICIRGSIPRGASSR